MHKPDNPHSISGHFQQKQGRCNVSHAMAVIPGKGLARIQKQYIMKLSKSLLAAIVVGVVIQSTTSCTKDKDKVNEKEKKESRSTSVPDNCPACGLG